MPGVDPLRAAEVFVIPLAAVILAWLLPLGQGRYRRRRFEAIVVRELRELAPFPESAKAGMSWWEHLRRQFVHPRIFADPSQNRDFILSLNPTLVYHVTQLWAAFAEHDARSWLHFLDRCAAYDRSGEVRKAHASWGALLREYGVVESPAARQ